MTIDRQNLCHLSFRASQPESGDFLAFSESSNFVAPQVCEQPIIHAYQNMHGWKRSKVNTPVRLTAKKETLSSIADQIDLAAYNAEK